MFQTNLKQGQSANPEAAEKEEKVPEFQKFKLRKVSEPPKVAEKKTNPDNELMRKLGKQKLAAENEGELSLPLTRFFYKKDLYEEHQTVVLVRSFCCLQKSKAFEINTGNAKPLSRDSF